MGVLDEIKFTFAYVVCQFHRQRRSFVIGCSTITIIVAFISLLYNSIGCAPLIFLKLAEIKIGEIDLLISNHSQTSSLSFVNFTELHRKASNENDQSLSNSMKGMTPRWILPATVRLKGDSSKNASVFLQVINSTNERKMDLSRSWNYGKLEGNEAILSESVERHFGFLQSGAMIGKKLVTRLGEMISATNESAIRNFAAMIMGGTENLYPPFGNEERVDADCYTLSGADYDGTESVTREGIKCKAWSAQSDYSKADNVQFNFCRNPTQNVPYFSTKPWCFTTSQNVNLSKQSCQIPNCHNQTVQCELIAVNDNETEYNAKCKKGIILSVEFAYLAYFEAERCGDDVFLQSDCFKNLTSIVYEACIGKSECSISGLQKYANGNMQKCQFRDFGLKFVAKIECNYPYKWQQKIYFGDDIMSKLDHFPLPFFNFSSFGNQTMRIDDVRWILLLQMLNSADFEIEFLCKHIVREPDGKWGEALGGVLLIESEFVQNYVRNQMAAKLDQMAMYFEMIAFVLGDSAYYEMSGDKLQKFDFSEFVLNDFAQFTIMNKADRLSVYSQNFDFIKAQIFEFGANLVRKTLFFSVLIKAPLLTTMNFLIFLRILLNSILSAMSVIIAVLSMIIIYCLMIIDVERSQFECGVLRSIGMLKKSLIYILSMKATLFCVFGIFFGLIVSHFVNVPITQKIALYVTVSPNYVLSAKSMLISSLFFGLFVPIISGIIPLRNALSMTLSNALNHIKKSANAQLQSMNVNFIISILLILVSFVCLYLIPYAVMSKNYLLFFGIFDFIFLGLLIGCGIICICVQHSVNLALCRLFCCNALICKNLRSHKARNSKTGTMLIVSSAFIVFSGCMLVLQRANFENLFAILSGADLIFLAISSTKYSLPQSKIQKELKNNEKIYDFTFVSWPIESTKYAQKVSISPIGSAYSAGIKNHFVGIEPNYCNVAFCEKYFKSNGAMTMSALFDDEERAKSNLYYPPQNVISGHFASNQWEKRVKRSKANINSTYLSVINVLASTALKKACGLSTEIALKINFRYRIGRTRSNAVYYSDQSAAAPIIASKVPGFYFSAHSQMANLQTLIASMSNYEKALKIVKKGYFWGKHDVNLSVTVLQRKLLVRMKNGSNAQDRRDVIDLIGSLLPNKNHFFITDTQQSIDGINKTTALLTTFFEFVAILTMFLCFFVSFISFEQNVQDNIYQFGVLRSIGICKANIVKMIVAESLIITVSSLFLGTMIGIFQSFVLTLQSQIVTENIFVFEFPIKLYLVLLICSLFIAVISSILPSIVLIKSAPAKILRMT